MGSWLSVCLATGLGPAHRKRRLGEAARAGRLPSTEQGAGLGWTEGASSGGRTGTGKGRFGPSPADPHPTLAVSFSQEDAKLPRGCAYSRVCEGRGAPRGPDQTSVCLDKSPTPANARVVGGLPLASARTQTTLLLKLGPAFRRSLPAGPSPRGPRPAACDPRRCAPRPGCCKHLSHRMVTNDRRTVKTGAGRL